MFKFLKEKIKSWLSTAKEPELIEEQEKIIEEKIEERQEKKKIKVEEAKSEKQQAEKEQEEEKKKSEKKQGFFEKLLHKKYRISEIYLNELFDELETILLENNVALEVVDFLRKNLKKELVGIEVDKDKIEEKVKEALKISLESTFLKSFNFIDKVKEKEPFVILFFGINGSGKTTTIAKIAYLLKQKGVSSVMAASDTFRAASIEQIMKHAEKLGIKVIKQHYGADPAAVAFDAVQYAKAHKIKVVLIDTAGRMHTEKSLMKEMEKIVRVAKPDLKIFIAESITGNDAVEQAKTFNNEVGIDGIILSKADVDEKGGTALSVSHITGKPILFLGTGQNYEDLQPFDKDKLIKELGL